jgi:hypothetical protein
VLGGFARWNWQFQWKFGIWRYGRPALGIGQLALPIWSLFCLCLFGGERNGGGKRGRIWRGNIPIEKAGNFCMNVA